MSIDPVKQLYTSVKGTGIFLDENDFREQLGKAPKEVYTLVAKNKATGSLFLDYEDFEGTLGLKKKPGGAESVSETPSTSHPKTTSFWQPQYENSITTVPKAPAFIKPTTTQVVRKTIQQPQSEDPLGDIENGLLDESDNLLNRRNELNKAYGNRDATAVKINLPYETDASRHVTELNQKEAEVTQEYNKLQRIVKKTGLPISEAETRQQLGQWVKDVNIDAVPLEVLAKKIPQTTTAKAYLKTFENFQDFTNAITTAPTIEQAALRWKEWQLVKDGSEGAKREYEALRTLGDEASNPNRIPEAKMGGILSEFLQQPAAVEWRKKSQGNNITYQQASQNLLEHYPSFGKGVIATKIANAREEKGWNNGFVNFTSKDGNDEIVQELAERGDLTPQEKWFYDRNKADINSQVKTPGFLNAVGRGYVHGMKNMAGTLEDLTGVLPSEQVLENKVQRESSESGLEVKGIHNFVNLMGEFAGQVLPIALVSKGLSGAGVAPTVANAAAVGLAFEHSNRESAIEFFPHDKTKQVLYTSLKTAVDMGLGVLYERSKILDGLIGESRPAIRAIVNDLTEGKISEAAAKEAIGKLTTDYAAKAAQLGAKTLEHNIKQSAQMAGFTMAKDIIDHALGGRDVSLDEFASDAGESAYTAFVSGGALSLMAAHGEMPAKLTGAKIMEIAKDPSYYKDMVLRDPSLTHDQQQERLQNIDHATSILEDLNNETTLSPKQKETVLLHELNQKALQDKLNKTTAISVKERIKEQMKQSNDAVKKIFASESENPQQQSVSRETLEVSRPVVTEEQKADDQQEAQDHGYEDVHEAMGSVKKRTGTEYQTFQEIPKDVLEQVSEDRAIENGVTRPKDETINVSEMLDKTGTYNGQKGHLFQDGQTVVFQLEGGHKEYELGNIHEIGAHSIKDYSLELERSIVHTDENGDIVVRGKAYKNGYSDPLQAITKDKDGTILSVSLDTENGQKRNFRGQVAEDIAYEITLNHITKNNLHGALEEFINTEEPIQTAVNDARPVEAPESPATTDHAPVSREPIEAKPTTKRTKPAKAVKKQEAQPAGERQTAVTSENAETVGVSHEARQERVSHSDQPKPERGEGMSTEESIKRGEELLKGGTDPNQVAENFKSTGKISGDDIAVVRAHYNKLVKATNDAVDKYGAGSPQDKQASAAEAKWYNEVLKPMSTEWSNIGKGLQGETDIDTGSFVGIRRAFEQAHNGKAMTPEQAKQAKELAGKVKTLTSEVETLKKKLTAALDKAVKEQESKAPKTFTERAKKTADTFRKLKTKPFVFKDSNGVEHEIQKMGVSWNDLVELGAKAIEKTGEIADGIAAVVEKIKDADWYKGLSDADKQSFANQLEAHYKQAQSAKEDLFTQFVDKKDSRFTLQEVKDVWEYAKSEYLDKEADYDDMISGVSTDLGLSKEQVRRALAQPKGAKEITDEMYRRQYVRNKAVNAAKSWVRTANTPKLIKALKAIPGVFFAVKTFGHGTVGMITHAGTNLFLPSGYKEYWNSFFKQFSYAFGDTATYEQAMADHVRDPYFIFWKRAGLAVDPTVTYDDYQMFTKYLGKLGGAGDRGFNALKVYRLEQAKAIYKRLSNVEKADPETAKEVAKIVNHATGTSKVPLPNAFNTVFFAPRLEVSRWARMITQPAQALATFTHWQSATPAQRAAAKIITKRAGQLLGTYIAALGANQALLSLTGSGQTINLTNPTQSDWLKFKAGENTIEFTGGMVSLLSFLSKLIAAATEPQKEIRGDRFDKMKSVTGDYLAGKFSPFAGTVKDLATHHDFRGNVLPFYSDKPKNAKRKLTLLEYLSEQQTPIPVAEAVHDVAEEMKANGATEVQINHVLHGIMIGAFVGGTGVKVGNVPKEKKLNPEMEAREQIKAMIRQGKKYYEVPADLKKRANISPLTLSEFVKDAKLEDDVLEFKNQKVAGQLSAWEGLSDEEKLRFAKALHKTETIKRYIESQGEDKKYKAILEDIKKWRRKAD